tara:strand:- start:4156 stop:4362 length:207 start_codon:yes stop_codon:yes gene_type:complete
MEQEMVDKTKNIKIIFFISYLKKINFIAVTAAANRIILIIQSIQYLIIFSFLFINTNLHNYKKYLVYN